MPTGWDAQPTKEESLKPGRRPALAIEPEPEVRRMESFIPEEPQRSFTDLVVPSSVRTRIETALSRIKYHDTLYREWGLEKIDPRGSRIAINLFGPPGTGKTSCAEAIARELGKKIITVNYAEIESKYVGETPKNITAAFVKAREVDAVLFFDEADSILGKRLTHVTQSADHGVNVSRAVMLTQLDKFHGVVVFATNLARNYDGAFVRRILAHIEFELPDEVCRQKLWQYLLPAGVPREADVGFEWLAAASGGLSGGDILNVIISAASRAVQRNGELRKISLSDLKEEIGVVEMAKRKVGAHTPDIVLTQEVRPEELPVPARRRYEEVLSNRS